MLDQALKNLFTLHGLITTILQISIIVGLLTCYIGFQTFVLGNENGTKILRNK